MHTWTHPFPVVFTISAYIQKHYIEAYRLILHTHTRADVQTHTPKQTDVDLNVHRHACSHNVKVFSLIVATSMTHKQLPFSPMKGDPLLWHGTSRCITKPHPLIMVPTSFCYTGKHLLIFVTSALSLKVLTGHLGTQIPPLAFFFLESCFILEYDCTMPTPCTALNTYCISRAVCQSRPLTNTASFFFLWRKQC